ncbi:hypothetical protein A4H97_11690 [Niastella yeongjuensis]|uniref:Imelysin-like domain-containing protein n=1 Tax=Niastella yeongjuensis TaxID=354355 RepID=A0A1V9E9N6_9BACT|nr:imelysin family protein [Niastella yeongjuensis]OQP42816.1 hypothetical protein A4H97_11690 [Niastella yeongjuensis]SEO55295.1 hypothetical protein SAMN05660816_03005 [Niastella yeongjuensis]
MKHKKLAAAVVTGTFCATLVLFSCSKSDKNDDSQGGGNQSDTVLVNLGANVISPAFNQLATATAGLETVVTAFTNFPTSGSLLAMKNAFKDAYKAWEGVSAYQFGPMLDQSLTTHFTNSFPADTAIIKSNIAGASYTMDGLGNFAAQGFPALDYLLFAYNDNYVMARFTTDANATGAKNYLKALAGALKTKAAAVANAWSATGGNYVDKFSKATGVDAGSSLSQLLNAFVQDFDVTLQNYKIGIPIGKYGPNTLPISPEKVEAYYSGYSVALLIAQLQAIQTMYLGGNGGGIDDKVAATTAKNNGLPLNDAIKNQINTLLAKLQTLQDPLSAAVQNNITTVNDTYTEVRKLTVLLKADMSSALGVKISFQDDDGD